MSQIPLDLRIREAYSLERLIIPDLLNSLFRTWLFDPFTGNQGYILVGGQATGKTHLSHAFVETRGALMIAHNDVINQIGEQNSLGPVGAAIIIDDAHLCDQNDLFHLYNRCLTENRPLCLSMKLHPLAWDFVVPDLESRLKSLRVLDLGPFVDLREEALLRKLFADRSITPSDDLITYLLNHCDRSIDSMRKLVENLHNYANGRPFTRSLAKDYVAGHDPRQYSFLNES